MKIRFAAMNSPVGPVALAWRDDDVIVALHMEEAKDRRDWNTHYAKKTPLDRMKQDTERRFGSVRWTRDDDGRPACVLERYFDGDVKAIDDLTVDPGGTPFQGRVWTKLRRIPAGRTRTYGELAKSAGSPGAARAAGGAVGSNPIAIVIPCHRAVGSDRSLTGFGGGIARKQWLLEHEGAIPARLV